MVNKRFSRGCHFCRSQHTKCDETKPECRRCIARGMKCPGYRDVNGFLFVDQAKKTSARLRKKSRVPPGRQEENEESLMRVPSPSSSSLAVDPGTISISFFFNTYLRRERNRLTSRGHFDHLVPLYTQSMPNSLLALATETLAHRSFAAAHRRSFDSPPQVKTLVRASEAMRQAINDPTECLADETLLAALVLDFGDLIVSKRTDKPITYVHQSAAQGLVRLRGWKNYESDVSRSLLFATRSNSLRQAFCTSVGIDTDLDLPKLSCSAALAHANPAVRLDRIITQALQLRWQLSKMSSSASQTQWHTFAAAIQGLQFQLQAWHDNLPEEWHPTSQSIVAVPEHPRLSDAFTQLHALAENYIAIDVAFLYNQGRCVRLFVLGLLFQLPPETLQAANMDFDQARLIEKELCASIPYFLNGPVIFDPDTTAEHTNLAHWYLLQLSDWILCITRKEGMQGRIDEADVAALQNLRTQLQATYKIPGT